MSIRMRRKAVRRAAAALWLLAAAGCGDAGAPGPMPEPALWPVPDVEPPALPLAAELPWLAELSSWSAAGCGPGQPDRPPRMGDLGLGNGRVFTLLGYACPLNTLHSMVGPGYQRHGAFFPDTASRLEVAGAEAEVESGHLFRVRGAPIAVSRERAGELELIGLSFAPRLDGADAAERSLVRAFWVSNRGAAAAAAVVLRTAGAASSRGDRQRQLLALEPAAAADPAALELGRLQPGQTRRVVLAYALGRDAAALQRTAAALRGHGLEALLERTRRAWAERLAAAARLHSPDTRVDDLLAGLLLTVLVQQAAGGGVGPMSHYTRIWTRDCAGPVRLLLRLGLHQRAREVLDYYHAAAVQTGGIRNSYPLDLDPRPDLPEPDWAAMGPMDGRTAAEAPSYLPLMARWYALATGDRSLSCGWFAFWRHALDGQALDERYRLSFSGDETFRTAMSLALGLHLEHDYHRCCWSANSAFLYVAAAAALAAEAAACGRPEAAADLDQRAERVRAAADETFWHPDGYWAPFVDRAAPGELPPPYEDVATKPLWTGALEPTAPRARSNLQALIDRTGRDDGLLVSPLHPSYQGLAGALLGMAVEEGVYTGMGPGYGLYNLAALDHPLAGPAFDALGRVVSATGNAAEYQVLDDHAALQFIYDAEGGEVGDHTARFRPWEGAILADALVVYLTGFTPDAPARRVALAPRLPNGWPWMRFERLRVGATRFDLVLQRAGDRWRAVVGPTDGGWLTAELALPLPACRPRRVVLDGRRLQRDEYTVWQPFGRTRIQLPAAAIGPARALDLEVLCR